jgi:hypothetical protein
MRPLSVPMTLLPPHATADWIGPCERMHRYWGEPSSTVARIGRIRRRLPKTGGNFREKWSHTIVSDSAP